MATYDSINAGSFMGTFFKAMALRMENDKYVQERKLDEGKKDVNTIAMYGMLRARNEHMSDADFLKEFPGAHSAAMKALQRQGVHKMLAAHSGLMDEEVGVMPVLDPNTGKIILMGKNKDGETVPVTQGRSADPKDFVSQFTIMELIDKAHFLAATKHGLSGFSLDNILASGAVDDSGTQPNQTVPAYRAGETYRVGAPATAGIQTNQTPPANRVGAPATAPGSGSLGSTTTRFGTQPPGPSSSTVSGTGTQNGDGSGDPAPEPPATTSYAAPDVMTPMPDAQGVVTRQGGLGDHYMQDGDTMHAGPGMPGSSGYTTAPLPEGMSPKRIDTRVIGVNTPELARDGQPAEPYADAAKAAAQRQLDQAGTITTTPGAGERQDKYKRQLSHVDLDGKNLAGEMLDQGMATAMPVGGNQSRADEYAQREADARAAEAGMFESQPLSSIEQRQVSRRGRITSERREQLARQKEIENLEKELSRLQSPARTRGGGVSAERRQARAAEIQQKRQARAAEIQQRLNELRNPEAVTPAASDTASTAPVKAPPSMEGSTQEDVVAAADTSAVDVAVDTDDTATATKSAESSLAVEAGKQAQTGGNSIGGAIQNISLQNSQNINYGMLSRQGLFASPNKLSPRQRSVIAASLFRGQWLRGELTPDIVSNMRNFVQTGMFLDEAKAQFTANKQAFDSLETVRKNSAAIVNIESQIGKRNFDMRLDTAKLINKEEDQDRAERKLGVEIAKEQADLEKETLAAVKTFQDSIAKMANDYGIREVGDENKQALAKTTTAIKNITENNLPAMTIASMVLDGQTMEEIAQLFSGKTPAQIKMLSAEALAKQYDRGHFNMFMDLISKYVAYNNKSRGQGWWDSAVNPSLTLREFAAGMENATILQKWFGDDPSELQKWMGNWELTEEKLKEVAVAFSAGQQVMQG